MCQLSMRCLLPLSHMSCLLNGLDTQTTTTLHGANYSVPGVAFTIDVSVLVRHCHCATLLRVTFIVIVSGSNFLPISQLRVMPRILFLLCVMFAARFRKKDPSSHDVVPLPKRAPVPVDTVVPEVVRPIVLERKKRFWGTQKNVGTSKTSREKTARMRESKVPC